MRIISLRVGPVARILAIIYGLLGILFAVSFSVRSLVRLGRLRLLHTVWMVDRVRRGTGL